MNEKYKNWLQLAGIFIVIIPSAIKAYEWYLNGDGETNNKYILLLLIFLGIVISILIFWAINELILRYRIFKRKLTRNIIEKRSSTIDWYDYKNNIATFYEEVEFFRIGRADHFGKMNVDGEIDCKSIQGFNLVHKLSNDKKKIDFLSQRVRCIKYSKKYF